MDTVIIDIQTLRTLLRAAHAEAVGDPALQADILQQLADLADLQERIELAILVKFADKLRVLSDALDRAIATIRNSVANVLVGDRLIELRNKVRGQLPGGGGAAPPAPIAAAAPAQPPANPPIPAPGQDLLGLSAPTDHHVQGPAVIALQLALISAGQAIEPDGDFGRITAAALRRWQVANGFPESDVINEGQWRTLTRADRPSLFDLCLGVTSAFEGTSFDRAVGNFDGAGVTFGLIGFTLANGELKALLNAIEAGSPGTVARAFGALYPDLMGAMDLPRAERIAWADSISLGANKQDLSTPWKEAFRRLGRHPAARRAQMQRAYDVYWTAAKRHIADFLQGKPMTDLDAAFWFDVTVQNGVSNAERAELAQASAGGAVGAALRTAFSAIVVQGSNQRWRADVRSRKDTFVGGAGNVHGSAYQLSSWGLVDVPIGAAELDAPSAVIDLVSAASSAPEETRIEPDQEAGEAAAVATTTVAVAMPLAGNSPHTGWTLYSRFTSYVATLSLRYFSADELLFLGGQNTSGSCTNLNRYPPEEYWRNIGPTIALLDKLRAELGAPVQLLSIYRSPEYNACIDGSATHSTHMRYMAIDFRSSRGSPGDWAATLRSYRSRGLFTGGIGTYARFVHVDTKGVNRDWTG